MNLLQCAKAYVVRKPVKSMIICSIFILIFLGELTGLAVYSIAVKGEKDAFLFEGPALFLESDAPVLTAEAYEKITAVRHVIGVQNWKENLAVPEGLKNVKDHTGIEPKASLQEIGWSPDSVVLLAQKNVELYSWFRSEKSVSLISGTFPTYENRGILVESRFAEQNQLSVGDSAAFRLQESGSSCSYQVCGIFKADTDFEITEDNTLGEGVFLYSPYNVIFLDYDYAAETMGFESAMPYGCTVFVDEFESVDQVGMELKKRLGEGVKVYNTASGYLSNERGIVVLMKNYSFMMLWYVSIIGCIIMLLVLSFYAVQYRQESESYLALGCGKGRIILQYAVSMLFIIAAAYAIAGVVCFFMADPVVSGLSDIAQQAIAYQETTAGPYRTPNLGQGFSMDLEVKGMLNVSSYIKLLLISFGFLLVSMAIPIYSVITTKPQILLQKK